MKYKMSRYTLLIFAFLMQAAFLLPACDSEEEFAFDKDHLTETHWGVPQIIEPGPGEIDLTAPTIFHPDGHMTIGPNRTDFWSFRDSRSIFIEQAREVWFIFKLNPDTLYVERTQYPDGSFIVKCMYHPMD